MGPGFESLKVHQPWKRWRLVEGRRESRPVGQEVKTPASHAGNMGSIPIRVTTSKRKKKTWVGKKDNQGSKAQKAYYTSVPVPMTVRIHPFPSRTRKLSSSVPTILGPQGPGKIGRRRHTFYLKSAASIFACRRKNTAAS